MNPAPNAEQGATNMIYTVIIRECCPCENCAGEIQGESTVEDFTSLREALNFWQNNHPYSTQSVENCGRWFSASGTEYNDSECEDCFGDSICLAVEASFHPADTITSASYARLARLIEKGRF